MDGAGITGIYRLQHRRSGQLIGEYEFTNSVTFAALEAFGIAAFGGYRYRAPLPSSPPPGWYFSWRFVPPPNGRFTGTTYQVLVNGTIFDWYIGLSNGASPGQANQMLTANFGEVKNYSGQRKQWKRALIGTGQLSNSASPATFTFTDSGTITGAFMAVAPHSDFDPVAWSILSLNVADGDQSFRLTSGGFQPVYQHPDLWGGSLFNTTLSVIAGDTLDVIYVIQL